MPRKSQSQVRYGRGTINPSKNGRGYDCFLIHDRKRHRARLPSIEQARAWIDMTEDATGANRPPLTKVQLADAAQATTLLPPGYTLTDAARALAASTTAPDSTLSIPEALKRFLAARAISAKPVTLKGYRCAGTRLASLSGPIPLAGVSATHVEAVLSGLSAGTRNATLRNLSPFFHWAMDEGIIKSAFIDRIGRARTAEPPLGILTPPEARILLDTATTISPALVPYLALALFAGIRPTELERLPPEKIGKAFIMLDGEVTKTANARSIKIRPNLRAWLRAFPPAAGRPVAPFNTRNRYRAMHRVLKETKIDWKHDCMRHSFATFAYEQCKDAALVSSEMGHAGTGVFFRHYRALANPGDGRRFFGIFPGVPGFRRKSNSSKK